MPPTSSSIIDCCSLELTNSQRLPDIKFFLQVTHYKNRQADGRRNNCLKLRTKKIGDSHLGALKNVSDWRENKERAQ
jgi:hypothetical protein